MASLELISAWQRQTGTFCKWVCSESYLLRVFSSFAMPWKEKCAEWMNPTHSWDWQLLCHQQLISLDAGGGRTSVLNMMDLPCVGLTLANLNARLKRSMWLTLYMLHAWGQWLHAIDSYVEDSCVVIHLRVPIWPQRIKNNLWLWHCRLYIHCMRL